MYACAQKESQHKCQSRCYLYFYNAEEQRSRRIRRNTIVDGSEAKPWIPQPSEALSASYAWTRILGDAFVPTVPCITWFTITTVVAPDVHDRTRLAQVLAGCLTGRSTGVLLVRHVTD